MSVLVMKFGGTSLGSLARMRSAAACVQREYKAGKQIVVVVSAMAGETDRLVRLAERARANVRNEEYDAIVASGEQASAGLFALVLQNLDLPARSWTGWQVPIKTTGHGRAQIAEIATPDLRKALAKKQIAVVAGFQGVSAGKRIATLGRGGSDTSAVALAAALKAEQCDIYTDVDGVYTADPRLVPTARCLHRVSYEEMLELASQGAKVLQTRAVGVAMAYNVPVRVRNSFASQSVSSKQQGTLVCAEEETMEQALVSGIAHTRGEAKLTLRRVPDKPGVAAALFDALAEADVNVDMIVQNVGADGTTDMTFTVPKADSKLAKSLLTKKQKQLGYGELVLTPNMAKVSIVGVGMRTHAGVAQKMFAVLAKAKINIQVISTSEIKVSVLIDDKQTSKAVQALHKAFELQRTTR